MLIPVAMTASSTSTATMTIPAAVATTTTLTATDDTLSLLAQSYLHSPQHLNTYVLPQFRHRLALMSKFNIPAGSKVLELGCGQGETTLVLAHLVGPTGHITGVDPARLDYGHPITVSAARNHILSSPLGGRISFHATDPHTYLSTLPAGHNFDFIILSHSLWYFPSKATVLESLTALRPYAPKLLVAEYSFEGTLKEQQPHVLAARCQAVFYDAKNPVQRAATEPNFWDEVESVLVGKEEVKKEVERLKGETRVELERVNAEAGVSEEKDVSRCRTMDVWWAEFERV
ncbi:uncharacterized protein LAJ45_05168 [Morchella importuna]|uniref:uncharacterized protein n=1 Tax=Morchella importuna TaxID=1174673 RepID=UPI001E8DB4D6|nr:uncharacterized protein LAJ45_05168 [Morchella importuna]KAH8150985.1 hypothetical protein LAJ45_05168 [Morchella importuna]